MEGGRMIKFKESIPGLPCDLTEASLHEAWRQLSPSRVYTVYIKPNTYFVAIQISRGHKGPLSPMLNVVIDPTIESEYGWYLMDEEGNAVGSRAP